MESKSQKIEEKTKYFFNNGTLDFSINIGQFEEYLFNFTSSFPDLKPSKNGYKLYGIDNKYFKIFQDGSCYGYIILKNSIQQMDKFVEHKQKTQQIYNDDFAGLKDYWIEEIYEEIIFKPTEDAQIVFSKMKDIPRNIDQYCIYIEPKSCKNIKQISSIFSEHFASFQSNDLPIQISS